MSINKVVISGNLTRDPELRATGAGTQVLSIGVAVNDRRRNQRTGDWEDYANFVDCTMFGSRAEAVSRYLRKGSKVAIEGKLRYSSWETKDGQRRSKLEVVVDEIEFLSPRGQQPAGAYPAPQRQAPRPPAPQAPAQYQPQQAYQPQQLPLQAPPTPGYAPQAPAQYQPQQAAQAAPEQPAVDLYDADIPF
jgi:single-strand DNA-binding protein